VTERGDDAAAGNDEARTESGVSYAQDIRPLMTDLRDRVSRETPTVHFWKNISKGGERGVHRYE